MSPALRPAHCLSRRFPRVSGDEPRRLNQRPHDAEFSPRERG